jgi:CRP-like cAMP-binding protein
MDAQNLSVNFILATMSAATRAVYGDHFRLVSLTTGTLLQDDGVDIEHVYFPTSGMISVLIATADGNLIETALIGKEGVANSFAAIGIRQGFNRAVMQVSGAAFRIEPGVLAEVLAKDLEFRNCIERYHAFLLLQSQQTAACNLVHSIEARLCRWLLQVRDRVKKDRFDLTQEFVAQMLGVSRPTVNVALNHLKQQGFLETNRGAITLIDIDGMKRCTCECYSLLKEKLELIV